MGRSLWDGWADSAGWSGRYHVSSVGALYVHVPFCVRKCRYCDFASVGCAMGSARLEEYVDLTCRRIDRLADLGLFDRVRTAYVGGGTPSMLGPALLERLCEKVTDACGPVEFSCEANPDTLTADVARAMAASGVTRVSVGVQSLENRELVTLGRLHDAADALSAIESACLAGLDVSCDLMCGIPLQTPESWERTLRLASESGVGHVSVYPLMVEDGTPLAADVDAGRLEGPDPDVQADLMLRASDALLVRGLDRYEVASYAKPGKRCEHNVAYWSGIPYAGVGVGASGMYPVEAYELLRVAEKCLPVAPSDCVRVRVSERMGSGASRSHFSVEFLDMRQATCEDLMLGCRMSDGVAPGLLAHARDVIGAGTVDSAVAGVVSDRLAELGDGGLAPTRDGWLLGNELYERMWDLSMGTIETRECR